MSEQIFVFTAGNPHARAHIRNSIEHPTNRDRLVGVAPEDLMRTLRRVEADQGDVYAWGSIDGPMNTPRWEPMEPGALVLSVYDAVTP